jgi:hypothetical protein
MTNLKHILYFTAVSLLLTSCASYCVISDNDVYLQKPAAIDLTDDQEDITSYNAYKAGDQGAYQIGDPRLRNTNARAFATYNARFMFGTYYNPFHSFYQTDPFRYGRPYGFGYGLNSPLYGMNTYYMPGFGYANNYGYGYGFNYGNCYYGCQYGNYMYPYNSNNFYGGTHTNSNSNYNGFGSSNYFYGRRNSLSGNSGRSSSYPNTLKNKMNSNASKLFALTRSVANKIVLINLP